MPPPEQQPGDHPSVDPPPTVTTPVFVDDSGRRHVQMRVLAWVLGSLVGGGALLIGAALALELIGGPRGESDLLPQPDLPTPPSSAVSSGIPAGITSVSMVGSPSTAATPTASR